MPSVMNSDRPTARPSACATTSPSASVTRRSLHTKGAATAPDASVKSPKRGKVARRVDPVTVVETAAAAPVNMRSLSKRNVASVCDSVSVAGRFESQSRCSAISPDTTVWTGEADGSIAIRLAPSGMEVSRINKFGHSTVLVLASVNGNMWAGYSDGAVRVLDHATQKLRGELTQHTAAVYAICAANGLVYTGGADWKVYQWEADDLHFCRMYHGHRNSVRCLATYNDPESSRRYVVSGSDDGTVKVWDASLVLTPMKRTTAKGEKDAGCIATLDGQGRGVLSLLVLEDTAELWVGSEDTAIRVWDLYSMTITSVITAHRTPVVTLQRVAETIWSGSKDNAIVITNRFSKDVVHQATQPPGAGGSGPQQRLPMFIQPVTRTVVHNVWTTSPDGSWQCWNFTAPECGAPYLQEDVVYPDGHYLSQSRNRPPSRGSQRRSSSVRAANHHSSNQGHNAEMKEEDAELRESVARTRRSVTEMLTEPAEVTLNGNGGVDSDGSGDDVDVPIEEVAKSILRDRTAETRKQMEHQQTALQKAEKQAEKLRAQLQRLGQDPAAVAAAAAAAFPAARTSAATDSPSTDALERVLEKLSAQKAENAALAAAIDTAKK